MSYVTVGESPEELAAKRQAIATAKAAVRARMAARRGRSASGTTPVLLVGAAGVALLVLWFVLKRRKKSGS